ncbi:50S ribosomal protein L11 methyltransferase [Alteraurantiacibacter aquimixticola]|uniref:Ribosomal protein L11 methyltransferase n=1 Tax=Alteraurantiacibacter aquimixticola TaxID=2489173 RepID=A0A4T3EZQ4_9SPHN|nr:50S ribosomal protein L11 methyltransferase [Alteraurantiacibacter aquimixticola]TIX50249.1 50S ribosomal protein L11 methyltransferase [Alteraurantiacibacter aquimixticola]
MSWKLSATASKEAVEAALEKRDTIEGWDENIVLTGFEVDPEEPDTWRLDAYLEAKPSAADRKAVKALFDGEAPPIVAEKLPDTDWVAESQKGIDPIRAGRFYVHTPDHPASEEPDVNSFCIPAAQAFGTGQHETTAGCLAMLDAMKRRGVVVRNLADIGTGTGLLAFAAMKLWPLADATASDIDPVCLPAVLDNAALNAMSLGTDAGELAMVIADGMEDEFLVERGPYDLLIANILAGPLISMAGEFAQAVAPRGHILLAGLLTTQEPGVRRAYMRAGFRLQARIVNGDWSILWLRHRFLG